MTTSELAKLNPRVFEATASHALGNTLLLDFDVRAHTQAVDFFYGKKRTWDDAVHIATAFLLLAEITRDAHKQNRKKS